MLMKEYINEFVDTMISEKSQFENLKSEVSDKESNVSVILNNLENNEKEIIMTLNSRISETKDENIRNIFETTSNGLLETMKEANAKIQEAVKGMTFIHDFESHFTVSVFGKVKAGKSYLGNLIMGQPFKKLGIESSYDKLDNLVVHVYDRGKLYEQSKIETAQEEKECNGAEFYVNNKEATSTIQWVDIGGMCWFDTPGIGSVTIENEILAKEYVKNSDLVIFACNSDAAGTRQEFSEIRQLHEMGKPLLLLLTQSDTVEYDVDEDGEEISILVPKSDKDRKDQEKYMLDTLCEQGMEDVLKYAEILTVSAKLANDAIEENDEEMFVKSNMGLLFKKLTEITKNDAAEMKKTTPKTRVNEMIDSIVLDLEHIKEQIRQNCSSIERNKEQLLERKDWMVEQIRASVSTEVLNLISMSKAKIEKNGGTVSEAELSDQISQIVKKIVTHVCIEESIVYSDKLLDLNICLSNIGDMRMRQDSIPYEYTVVRSVVRSPHGIGEWIGEKFLNKQYYTSKMKTEMRKSVFDIGVNDNEIANNIMLQLNNVFSTTVDDFIGHLTEGYYEPVALLERKTIEQIDQAIYELKEERM